MHGKNLSAVLNSRPLNTGQEEEDPVGRVIRQNVPLAESHFISISSLYWRQQNVVTSYTSLPISI